MKPLKRTAAEADEELRVWKNRLKSRIPARVSICSQHAYLHVMLAEARSIQQHLDMKQSLHRS